MGLAENIYWALEETLSGPDKTGALLKLLDLAGMAVHPLCRIVAEAGRQPPEAGHELTAEDGEVIAEAELAWSASLVAVLLPEQMGGRQLFEEPGLLVFTLDEEPMTF